MGINKDIYNIPKQYKVIEENGLKGLIRVGPKGNKLLMEIAFNEIIVGRAYNKILICASMATTNHMLLYTPNGRVALGAKIYDIIFGRDFLYIKTIRPSSGGLEWGLVDKEFAGAKFIGDIEFVDRSSMIPFYTKQGYTSTTVRMGDKLYILDYVSGELTEIVERNTKEEERVEFCNIYFKLEDDTEEKANNPHNCVYLLNTRNNSEILRSTSIGELKHYRDAISNILGGTENIPIERAKNLVECITMVEKYGNGVFLPVVAEYVSNRLGTDDRDALVKHMREELVHGWGKLDEEGNLCKLYTSGGVGVVLIKMIHGKITVVPFIINRSNGVVSEDDIDKIRKCYRKTGCKTVRLELSRVKNIGKTAQFDNYANMLSLPYCVEQRKRMKSQIKNISYRYVEEFEVECKILSKYEYEDTNDYGTVKFNLVLFNDLIYLNKKRSKFSGGEMIVTNIKHLQVI